MKNAEPGRALILRCFRAPRACREGHVEKVKVIDDTILEMRASDVLKNIRMSAVVVYAAMIVVVEFSPGKT